MPTLTVDIPPAEYDWLQQEAAAAGRTVEQEARARLVEQAGRPAAEAAGPAVEVIGDWALRPGNDDTGPLDFERPITGPVIRAVVISEVERLPALPVILEPTPE